MILIISYEDFFKQRKKCQSLDRRFPNMEFESWLWKHFSFADAGAYYVNIQRENILNSRELNQ
jgi:hypothetical protein